MKKYVLYCLTLSLIYPLWAKQGSAQNVQFKCDSNFKYYQTQVESDSLQEAFDSFNRIEFLKEDFELRFWQYNNGLVGSFLEVYILRHYRTGNWAGYFYEGLRGNEQTHKPISVFFGDAENGKDTGVLAQGLWDSLLSKNILTVEGVSNAAKDAAIRKENKKLNEAYDDPGEVAIPIEWADCDCHYVVELITADCKHSFDYECCLSRDSWYADIPEVQRMKMVVEYLYKFLKKKKH